ncbi:WD repeat-containing protein 91-like [Diaphorina citri]|uniref:WD repeat-containing protein 91-like n=1 Tax=Diaphorina citri TaxID=121845 RepID=A0A3Q0J151_DIACI|nr:WD repeat-containing protein 91-like [Diaphorina citri]
MAPELQHQPEWSEWFYNGKILSSYPCTISLLADKVTEFLSKMAPELQHQPEWSEWFLIPFIKNPEENTLFSLYFSRQWQDTLLISLHNFLACVYQVPPQPVLCSYEEEVTRLRRLTEENEMLRARLNLSLAQGQTPSAQAPMDLMDDFYNIAQETPTTTNESQVKSLKNLIKSIGGGGQPSNPILNNTGNSTFYSVSDNKPVSKQRQSSTPSHQMKMASPSAEEKVPHLGVAKRSASVEGRKLRDSSLSHASPSSSSKSSQSFLVLSQVRENLTSINIVSVLSINIVSVLKGNVKQCYRGMSNNVITLGNGPF